MLASAIANTADLEARDAIAEIVNWLTGMWVLAGGEDHLDPTTLNEQEQLWLTELERELFSSR